MLIRTMTATVLISGLLAAACPAGSLLPSDEAPELNATVPNTFVRHAPPKTGVSLQTPASWNEVSPNALGMVLALMADEQGSSVNLMSLPPTPNQTLETTLANVPDQLKLQVNGFRLISADLLKLHGQPAGRIIYQATAGQGMAVKCCQFFVLRGQTQYILTFAARAENFEGLFPTVQQVAVSMQVP